MRICPKCGKKFPGNRMRCDASYGTPAVKCETATIELIDWTDEDEARAMQDLEDGILEDPFEDYEEKPKPKPKAKAKPKPKLKPKVEPEPKPEPEPEPEPEPKPDLREDLGGQADHIHDLLEEFGSMTYKELAVKLGVSPKRASNIVSTMIRDGVDLKRKGLPRKVSLG